MPGGAVRVSEEPPEPGEELSRQRELAVQRPRAGAPMPLWMPMTSQAVLLLAR